MTDQQSRSTASAILADVRSQFGITFTETCTGGGCMALEARLESGHWIVATDENLMPFEERVEFEAQERERWEEEQEFSAITMGWAVYIYPHDEEDNTWMQSSDEALGVWDQDSSAECLPGMVYKALKMLAGRK